jgi:hypothetical protein
LTITKELARDFAIMLQTGMPSMEAIRYLLPADLEAGEIRQIHDRWLNTRSLQDALTAVQGKSWQEMSLEDRINLSIKKHYTEMAYFLYSRNYSELEGAAKLKADTCRDALEKHLAGTAGQRDGLAQFLADVKNGVVKLGAPPKLTAH